MGQWSILAGHGLNDLLKYFSVLSLKCVSVLSLFSALGIGEWGVSDPLIFFLSEGNIRSQAIIKFKYIMSMLLLLSTNHVSH